MVSRLYPVCLWSVKAAMRYGFIKIDHIDPHAGLASRDTGSTLTQ